MGTIVSLAAGGLFCTFTFDSALPFLFRFGWTYFFYLLGTFERMLATFSERSLSSRRSWCHLVHCLADFCQ